jgi:ABC-type oligopeptide transport system substrate-binding subunit
MNTGFDYTTMFNDFNENEGDYYLNPIASQFKRIDIQLKDKNDNIVESRKNSSYINSNRQEEMIDDDYEGKNVKKLKEMNRKLLLRDALYR